MSLKAPFPWFGGKSRAAPEVWAALGDVPNYVEPFAGSLAVLLNRPAFDGRRTETVNDADGHLVNVWRSIAWSPDETAKWADWPVSEADLSARHLWLVEKRRELTDRLCADPEWHDPKAAGWWLWGICSWIGSGWCSGEGPWSAVDGRLVTGNAGRGINRQLPHLGSAGMGINRKLPHLGNAGRGINRKLPHLGNAGRGINRKPSADLFAELTARLRDVRICCGDWSRVVTPSVTYRHGTTGVVLDPPYPDGFDPHGAYSGQDGDAWALWRSVTEWAAENGENPGLRIVLCGYEGLWTPPDGWRTVAWKAHGGYGSGNGNPERERLWCSPACLDPRQPSLFGGP